MEPTDLSVKNVKKSYTPRTSPRDVTNLSQVETSRSSAVVKDRRSAFVPVAPSSVPIVPPLPYSAFLTGLPHTPLTSSTSVANPHVLTGTISVYSDILTHSSITRSESRYGFKTFYLVNLIFCMKNFNDISIFFHIKNFEVTFYSRIIIKDTNFL